MEKRTLRDLTRKEIYQIAEAYAKSPIKKSASHYAEECNISEHTFYSLTEKAVVEGIVPDKIVDLMQAKAMANAGIKAGAPGKRRSWNHYELLKARRKTFCFSSKKYLQELATDFANSSLSLKAFAKSNYMTPDLLERTIDACIDYDLLSEETMALLKEKRK